LGLAYNYSYSDQDNRQVGREGDDFKTDDHSLEANIQISDSFQFGFLIGRVINKNLVDGCCRRFNPLACTGP
jgi:hypothetical protein